MSSLGLAIAALQQAKQAADQEAVVSGKKDSHRREEIVAHMKLLDEELRQIDARAQIRDAAKTQFDAAIAKLNKP